MNLLKANIRRTPLYTFARVLRRRLSGPAKSASVQVSSGYKIITSGQINRDLVDGWRNPTISEHQRKLVDRQLQRMYDGDVASVFRVASEAVRSTGIEDPFIVEIGCASGYYSQVLSHLLGRPMRYVGVDYSEPPVHQARQYYPDLPLVVADACHLPLADGCCDILFSPALLMHVPEYEKALRESLRVTRSWCIFHRTPVVREAPTTHFSKYAYGVPVVELVFNEGEFLDLVAESGAEVVITLTIERHSMNGLDELVTHKTFVCRKSDSAPSSATNSFSQV